MANRSKEWLEASLFTFKYVMDQTCNCAKHADIRELLRKRIFDVECSLEEKEDESK